MLVIPMWIHFVAMFAAAGFALRVGERDERLAASGYMMINLLMFGYGSGDGTIPRGLEVALFIVEAVGFTALALIRRRSWLAIPCAVAWCELATAALHQPLRLHAWTYGTVQLGWFYVTWTTITAASWRTWRRRTEAVAAGS